MPFKDHFDEREELIFYFLTLCIIVAVPFDYLSGLEAIGGVSTLYGLLLGSRYLRKAKKKAEGDSDG